ncbi:SDR family oxidoreductase [Occallatibacter riparius]|uniref:SDR family oxidoreductase n=1 Tax=Occallatibacter riparius TaxID=1002689 RepID=A0A9J7BT54_9BACT|nr:SDR family oxidoreductase [Occallatibacter riparius]UWZ85769.1 SDR family oxidoreductase [Occallatibacter riparius]
MRKHEVVVITGASAGVGRAAVREFARHGAHVGLIARGRDGLEAAAREVEAFGGRALVLQADVADAQQLQAAADRVERELGPIDIWVNNAMASVFSPIREMTPEEFKRVTEVTYLGYVYGSLAALKYMLPRDRGTIVHVGSALAYRSIPLQAAYCASKHAILGFFAALRTELLHDGSNVQTTMVQMPALNTPQFGWVRSRLPRKAQPVPPIYQPEVAARLIYHAAHHPQRREWYGAWSVVKAVFGNKLVPSYADHYLAKQGYESQQYDGAADPHKPDNLYDPLPGDHGAHGAFNERAKTWSAEAWAEEHSGLLGTALSIGIAAAAWALLKRRAI